MNAARVNPPIPSSARAPAQVPTPRASKQVTLTADLVRQITRGELLPGDQLPTLQALQARHGVALKTVQRSVDQLKECGVLTAQRGSGTFVESSLALLGRYGLVFRDRPGDVAHWSPFYTALQTAATAGLPGTGASVEVYEGMRPGDADGGDLAFGAAMDAHRLGGLIYGTPAFALQGTRAVDGCVLPRVGLQSRLDVQVGMDAAVYPDFADFARRSLAWLAAQGCHRPAIVAQSDYYLDFFDPLLEEMQASGLEHRQWWFQAIPQSALRMATNAVLALFNPHQGDRPDSLIIIDDQITDTALRGLELAGLVAGRDLRVLAYQNRPATRSLPPGVSAMGFDAAAVLRACVGLLQRVQRGETVPELTPVPSQEFFD